MIYANILFTAWLLLMLTSCSGYSNWPNPDQIKLCRQLSEKELTNGSKRRAYQQCINNPNVQADDAAQNSQSLPPSAPSSISPQESVNNDERYVHCHFNQQEVIATSRRMYRINSEILKFSALGEKGLDQRLEAEREYSEIIGELERLIPTDMRKGMPLIPEAIETFSRCDKEELQ